MDKFDIVEYRLTVHVFGACSSPSVDNYALRQTTIDNECNAKTVPGMLNNFYVDDLLKSFDNVDTAAEQINEIADTLANGGFTLTSFNSNLPQVTMIC